MSKPVDSCHAALLWFSKPKILNSWKNSNSVICFIATSKCTLLFFEKCIDKVYCLSSGSFCASAQAGQLIFEPMPQGWGPCIDGHTGFPPGVPTLRPRGAPHPLPRSCHQHPPLWALGLRCSRDCPRDACGPGLLGNPLAGAVCRPPHCHPALSPCVICATLHACSIVPSAVTWERQVQRQNYYGFQDGASRTLDQAWGPSESGLWAPAQAVRRLQALLPDHFRGQLVQTVPSWFELPLRAEGPGLLLMQEAP